MKKLLVFVTFASSLLSSPCFADSYSSIPEKFFTYIKQGKTSEAIDYVYGTNKWISKDSDQVVNLKNQLSQLNKLVGNYVFHELIVEEKAGTRYVHLIYLVGFERQPLRFELKLYKPAEEWRFHGVSFDAKLTDDIEKQANDKLTKR
jgi:hypothetical protein